MNFSEIWLQTSLRDLFQEPGSEPGLASGATFIAVAAGIGPGQVIKKILEIMRVAPAAREGYIDMRGGADFGEVGLLRKRAGQLCDMTIVIGSILSAGFD